MDRAVGPDCPRCGTPDARRIVYGLPGPDFPAAAERHRLVSGGCSVTPDDPTRACEACDHRWKHPGDDDRPEG